MPGGDLQFIPLFVGDDISILTPTNLSEVTKYQLRFAVMVFERPPGLEYPKVWRRFVSEKNGQTFRFRIQDMTPDLYEESVMMLLKYFTRDEPPCKYIEVNNHPKALGELEKLWRKTVNEKFSIICVIDGDSDKPQLVGLNALSVVCKNDPEEPFQSDDQVWSTLFGAVDLVGRSVDIFEKYNVDKYLTAYGLVVVPEFRGMNVGKEILLARIPLCKALDIKVTATVFTAASSQIVAKKAGFDEIYEITYSELDKKGFVFPGILSSTTKSSKLMALTINP